MANTSFIGYDTKQGSLRELVAAALTHIREIVPSRGLVYLIHDSSVIELKGDNHGVVLSIEAALQVLHDQNQEATLFCLDQEGQEKLEKMIHLRAESYGERGGEFLAQWKTHISPEVTVPVYNYSKRVSMEGLSPAK